MRDIVPSGGVDFWIVQAARVVRQRTQRSARSSFDSLVLGDAVAAPGADGIDASLAFTLRLSHALLGLGMSAHRVEESLDRLAVALGLEIDALCTPTAIFVTMSRAGATSPLDVRTRVVRVEPGLIDLERLSALHDLVGRVERKEISPGDGAQRIEGILARTPRYGPVLGVAAFGLLSTSASILLGGSGLDVPIAGALGLVVGALDVVARPVPTFGRLLPSLAAFSVSFLASFLASRGWPLRPSIVLLAALVVLLPGFTVTTAMMELASAHLVSGTSRLMGGIVTFLQLGFGVALGQKAVDLLPDLPELPTSSSLPRAALLAAPLLSALGFTVLLRARPRDARWVLAAVLLGLLMSQAAGPVLGPELGAFTAALAVAGAANLFARLADRPVHLMLVPGILLLVPGSVGFLSVRSLLENDAVSAVSTAFRMALVAMALAAGVLVATAAVPPRKAL